MIKQCFIEFRKTSCSVCAPCGLCCAKMVLCLQQTSDTLTAMLNKGFRRWCSSGVTLFWLWACYLSSWPFSFCVSTNMCRKSSSAGVPSYLVTPCHGRAVGAIRIADWLNCSAIEQRESNHLLSVSPKLECCLQFWVLPFKKLKHSWTVLMWKEQDLETG